MIRLAKRLERIKPSATLAIDAKSKAMQKSGIDVINLSVGEPDFDTPDFIKEAGIKAIQEGFTKYTSVDGIQELKLAIIEKFKRDNSIQFKPDNVIVSCGLKQSIYNLAQAVLNEGDEVIIPTPYWVSYPPIVKLAGGEPIILPVSFENQLKICAKDLEELITPKTRMVILNSPSNPAGVVYTKDELKEIGNVLEKYPNIVIFSDEIYEYIYWGEEKYHNILNVCPSLANRTVIGNGVSKSYSMTGWRIGYAAGPENIIKGMKKIQSQSTSGANSIAQKAAVAGLLEDRHKYKYMIDSFEKRCNLAFSFLSSMDRVKCLPTVGAFYIFADFSEVIKKLGMKNDIELAELLLTEAKVAIVPGSEFGIPGFIRISCATSENKLLSALQRIKDTLI